MKTFVAAGLALAVMAGPAAALDLSAWNLSPQGTELFDNYMLKLRGTANGSAYWASQPDFAGLDQAGVTGAATLMPSIERDYDSGMVVALKSAFEVYHDDLSIDNYGGDFVQKAYLSVQTGLGRVEVGNEDGAAYTLAVTGPVVEGDISIDNTNASFFRDPTTGTAFINVFALNSASESSLNYAKVSYYSPRLFGIQLAGSFTPSEGKDVVPFLDSGPRVPDRQKSLWELAASYTHDMGALSLQLSAGWTVGHDDDKTPGHAGLTDWSLGGELDYTVNDDWKLALGGAFRHSNSYAFNVNDVQASGETTSAHLSATATHGPWIAGLEWGNGDADGRLGSPTLGVHGALAAVGYVLNTNMQLNVGWEEYRYSRSAGAFYNGSPRIHMDAAFLHLMFQV
jgi:Gram-negative porin